MRKEFMEAMMNDEMIRGYLENHEIDKMLDEVAEYLEIASLVYRMIEVDFCLIKNGNEPYYMKNNPKCFVDTLKFAMLALGTVSFDDAMKIANDNESLITDLMGAYTLEAYKAVNNVEDVEED